MQADTYLGMLRDHAKGNSSGVAKSAVTTVTYPRTGAAAVRITVYTVYPSAETIERKSSDRGSSTSEKENENRERYYGSMPAFGQSITNCATAIRSSRSSLPARPQAELQGARGRKP